MKTEGLLESILAQYGLARGLCPASQDRWNPHIYRVEANGRVRLRSAYHRAGIQKSGAGWRMNWPFGLRGGVGTVAAPILCATGTAN